MIRFLLALVFAGGLSSALRAGMLELDVTKPTDRHVKVSPSKPSPLVLLEVVETKTGKVVKTLYAGIMTPGQSYPVERGRKLSPGSYKIRYREGINFALDGSLSISKGQKWCNPADVLATDKAVFVWDCGRQPPKPPKNGTTPPPPSPVQEDPAEGRAFIYKFLYDGKPDVSFGDHGRVGPFLGPKDGTPQMTRYYDIRSIAADTEGHVYIGSTYHDVLVVDPNGERSSQTIGGYDGDPHGPKCTAWVNALAVGWKNRLYIPNGYGNIKVYDTTKSKFDGILYAAKLPGYIGDGRSIAADMAGAVYVINRAGRIQRFLDKGTTLEAEYGSAPDVKMVEPMGICASGGLVWAASHGGPPLWDSDGGEILMFWDNDSEFQCVEHYGMAGKSADKLEFLNPSAVAMSPDHVNVWVTEDGAINDEGPPGNARVRKFKITAARTEEIPLEVGN